MRNKTNNGLRWAVQHWQTVVLVTVTAVILLVLLVSGAKGLAFFRSGGLNAEYADGVKQVDPDTFYFERSRVEVHFSDVLLSNQKETRKLIVSEQTGDVSMTLTDRVFQSIDADFLKKTQTVGYSGKGYFVVDLDQLTEANVVQDEEAKTLTIRIGHAYLQAVEIDPDQIRVGDVQKGLLAFGDIKLTVQDYNTIEKELRSRMEQKFNTVANGQKADEIALRMVKEIYEPIVTAIDRRYTVRVEFQ